MAYMGLQLNITFNSISQNKVRPCYRNKAIDTREGFRFSMFHLRFADCAGSREHSAKCDQELRIMPLSECLAAAHNRCREDQPHLCFHPSKLLLVYITAEYVKKKKTLGFLSSCCIFTLYFPKQPLDGSCGSR